VKIGGGRWVEAMHEERGCDPCERSDGVMVSEGKRLD
jgi:hypothetical protein